LRVGRPEAPIQRIGLRALDRNASLPSAAPQGGVRSAACAGSEPHAQGPNDLCCAWGSWPRTTDLDRRPRVRWTRARGSTWWRCRGGRPSSSPSGRCTMRRLTLILHPEVARFSVEVLSTPGVGWPVVEALAIRVSQPHPLTEPRPQRLLPARPDAVGPH